MEPHAIQVLGQPISIIGVFILPFKQFRVIKHSQYISQYVLIYVLIILDRIYTFQRVEEEEREREGKRCLLVRSGERIITYKYILHL